MYIEHLEMQTPDTIRALEAFREIMRNIPNCGNWNLIAQLLRNKYKIPSEIIGRYIKPRYDEIFVSSLG